MQENLTLKINGVKDINDLLLVKENLKNQNGVRSIKIFPAADKIPARAEIKIDNKFISAGQVKDIITLGGDFRVEDTARPSPEKQTAEKNIEDQSNQKYNLSGNIKKQTENPPKVYFIWGLVAGLLAISLIINAVLGYILLKSERGGTSDWGVVAKNTRPVANPPDKNPSTRAAAPEAAIENFVITEDDHVRGNLNAPITLVEYSDFECPYCGRVYSTFKQILNDYPKEVRLVYKYFPLSFHPNAQKASEAAECASEQGKFWEYHDKLFDNQSRGFSLANFKQWASDLGLDTGKFNNCLDTGKYAARVRADEADGQKRGVQGTPATFINGTLISGALPYDSFKSIIDQILSN